MMKSAPLPPVIGSPSVTSHAPTWWLAWVGSGLLHVVALAACAWTASGVDRAAPRASDGGEAIELTTWSEPVSVSVAPMAPPVEMAVELDPARNSDRLLPEPEFKPFRREAAPHDPPNRPVQHDRGELPAIASATVSELDSSAPARVSEGSPPEPRAGRSRAEPSPEIEPANPPHRQASQPVSPAPRSESRVADVQTGIRTVAREKVHCPTPGYPPQAIRQGWSGSVKLRVMVGPSGRVLESRIHRSSTYPILDQAARQAVKEWRFAPGDELALFVVPVRFRLE